MLIKTCCVFDAFLTLINKLNCRKFVKLHFRLKRYVWNLLWYNNDPLFKEIMIDNAQPFSNTYVIFNAIKSCFSPFTGRGNRYLYVFFFKLPCVFINDVVCQKKLCFSSLFFKLLLTTVFYVLIHSKSVLLRFVFYYWYTYILTYHSYIYFRCVFMFVFLCLRCWGIHLIFTFFYLVRTIICTMF